MDSVEYDDYSDLDWIADEYDAQQAIEARAYFEAGVIE